MKKSELRQIIKEEYKKLNEENVAEKVARILVKSGKVDKGTSQKDMEREIVIATKEILGVKTAKRYLGWDPDYWSDVISSINYVLKRAR